MNTSMPVWYAHQADSPDRNLSLHCSLVLSVKSCLMLSKEFNGTVTGNILKTRGKKSSLLHFPDLSQVHSSQHLRPLATEHCSFLFHLLKSYMFYFCPETMELPVSPFKEGSQSSPKHTCGAKALAEESLRDAYVLNSVTYRRNQQQIRNNNARAIK